MSTYPGGKNGAGTYQKIINQLPVHQVYIEPFLGSGAILHFKAPALASIAIDSDSNVITQTRLTNHTPNTRFIVADALEFLSAYPWQGGELIYADPPYLLSTRTHQLPLYRHEFGSHREHAALLKLLKSIPAAIALSGYASSLYADELAGWRSITYPVMTRGGHTATETLWMNYPEPAELHDYRYLGDTFRERERIKRKQNRWRARLQAMPQLERYALLSVISQLATPEPAILEQTRDHITRDGDNGSRPGTPPHK